jgi:hypothetical protein
MLDQPLVRARATTGEASCRASLAERREHACMHGERRLDTTRQVLEQREGARERRASFVKRFVKRFVTRLLLLHVQGLMLLVLLVLLHRHRGQLAIPCDMRQGARQLCRDERLQSLPSAQELGGGRRARYGARRLRLRRRPFTVRVHSTGWRRGWIPRGDQPA